MKIITFIISIWVLQTSTASAQYKISVSVEQPCSDPSDILVCTIYQNDSICEQDSILFGEEKVYILNAPGEYSLIFTNRGLKDTHHVVLSDGADRRGNQVNMDLAHSPSPQDSTLSTRLYSAQDAVAIGGGSFGGIAPDQVKPKENKGFTLARGGIYFIDSQAPTLGNILNIQPFD